MDSRKKFRKSVFMSVVCLLAVYVSIPMGAFGANKPFPFEDVNNNGVYDSGDRDITSELKTGIFETPASIVIPAGLGGFLISGDIMLVAGKNITVSNYYLIGTRRDAILVLDAGETVTVGDGTTLKSAGSVSIHAGQDIAIGSRAAIYAYGDVAEIYSSGGNILVEEKATLYGKEGLYLFAEEGKVTVLAGSQLNSRGYLTVRGVGDLKINGDRVDARGAYISTEGHLIEFCNNNVKVSKNEGWIYLGAAGSTVNISGTKFQNLDPDNLTIEAGEIIQ